MGQGMGWHGLMVLRCGELLAGPVFVRHRAGVGRTVVLLPTLSCAAAGSAAPHRLQRGGKTARADLHSKFEVDAVIAGHFSHASLTSSH